MSLYALNLFDLAANDDYRAYSRRSVDAVGKYGGRVVALGRLAGAAAGGNTEPRQAMVLVEWPSREAFDDFVADPEHHDLHPLRENGTERYLWWLYERLDDLRPLFALTRDDATRVSAERVIDHDPALVWALAADASRLGDWLWGVDEVTVEGHAGAGLRHVTRGPAGEVARVCEAWEPQALVRWRDLDAGSWLELRLEPEAYATRARVEVCVGPGGEAPDPETEQRLGESLERIGRALDERG